MRVLHVTTGLLDGGAEAVLYRLCAADKKNTHSVVSLLGPGKYGPRLEQQGIRVQCLNMRKGRFSLFALRRLTSIIRTERPDVVQTWMYHGSLMGGVAARFVGRMPVIWGIHHSSFDRSLTKRSTLFVVRILAIMSHLIPARIIYAGSFSRKVHNETGYNAAKSCFVPNGCILSEFHPDRSQRLTMRAEMGISDTEIVLGMVARHDPQKDHENLLSALGILRSRGIDFVCLLIGTGLDGSNQVLSRSVQAKGLNGCIRWLGPRSDIPAVMNALDVHVLSSATETFPNTIVEAMACGTPCVATDVGDTSTIIANTGWVRAPKDPLVLADAIEEAIRGCGTPQWQERRRAARERIVNQFSIEKMADAYDHVWRSCLSRARQEQDTGVVRDCS
jgi:glycosyltransferase involved in cell wall biosynthesis